MDMSLKLPVLLGIAMVIGIIALIRLLRSPDSSFERRARSDRRRNLSTPDFPFYDSNRQLVQRDRRSQADRRFRNFSITIRKYPNRSQQQ